MTEIKIPFNRPGLIGREQEYMAQTVSGRHLSGDGAFTKKCHSLLENAVGSLKTLLTTSCTHSLEMAALLLEIKPGDEVIIPSFTFVSTANAFVLRGAKPVFVDIRPDTLNLDENLLERHITSRTRAIVPIHYAGVGCEMDTIGEIASRYNLAIVEDNAQGLYARYQGRPLGSFGQFSTVSFHETKNFVCGEGGALFVNDPAYVDRAEIIREKGTNRSRYFRGQVDKYTWVDIGSSYLMSEILAAFLFAQLEGRDQIQARRKVIWETYRQELDGWANANNVRLPIIPANCEQPYHLFYLLLPDLEERQDFIKHMAGLGIQTAFHYQPLHLSGMGQQWGYQAGECPVTEKLSDCLVRLPLFHELTDDQLTQVIDAVKSYTVAHQPATIS